MPLLGCLQDWPTIYIFKCTSWEKACGFLQTMESLQYIHDNILTFMNTPQKKDLANC